MVTFTVDKNGVPGMPTFNVKKVRKLLKTGRAEIFCCRPFTIKLLYAERLDTQPAELCMDTGDKHIGVSVKSEKHEFVHAQHDPLPDEKKRHDSRRKYRRSRRARRRYRKPKFDNRKKPKGWIAPSLEHKKDLHISIVKRYMKVCPITSVTAEVGTFDTQLLEAIESGKHVPHGKDYQHGKRYLRNTLRDAVFYRDGYRCLLCGSKTGPFRLHHTGYWKGDHTDRMGGLGTLCLICHTPANHQKDGPLWGWEPKIRPMTGAAFMNTVRWMLVEELKEETGLPVHTTYGSMTKTMRRYFCIEKTHANDAFVMGMFHPKHRQRERLYVKQRRNDRVLSKFYDAVYIDTRDGKERSGRSLSCGRTKRSQSRRSVNNRRVFRGDKLKKGRVSIRRRRTDLKPGSIVMYMGEKLTVHGTHARKNKKTGEVSINVEFTRPAADGKKSADLKKLKVITKEIVRDWKHIEQ